MKKTYIAFAVLAAIALFATSCVKDIEPMPESPVETPEELPEETPADMSRITASFPQDVDSKVSMDETSDGLDLKWDAADLLTVVGTTTETFAIESISEDGKTATFKGSPVEGDSFKVILSSQGVNYLERSFKADSRPDNGSDLKANIEYDAVLENVKDYTSISFTQEWAEANGATFSQTGCLMLYLQLPDGCVNVDYVKLAADAHILSDKNVSDGSLKNYSRTLHFNSPQTPSDGLLMAYFMTSMNEDVIPAGTRLSVMLETKDNNNVNFFKTYTLDKEYSIKPGKRNVLKLNKEGWEKRNTHKWDLNKANWTAPYTNICVSSNGPSKLIDSTYGTIWEYPYRDNHLRIDQSFSPWTYDVNPDSYLDNAPFVAIINLNEIQVLQLVQLIPRQANNAKYASTGEVWVSADVSNETDEHAEYLAKKPQDVTNDDINGCWNFWNAKKWVKVWDFNVNYTYDSAKAQEDARQGMKKASIAALPAKYVKIVMHEGKLNKGVPILSLAELELKAYPLISE